MSDALSVAQAAQLKAIEALTQVAAHERECARRYQEQARAQEEMNEKLDMLLEQNNLARGRAERNQVLLGGIPNAFWVAVIALGSSGFVAFATIVLKHP